MSEENKLTFIGKVIDLDDSLIVSYKTSEDVKDVVLLVTHINDKDVYVRFGDSKMAAVIALENAAVGDKLTVSLDNKVVIEENLVKRTEPTSGKGSMFGTKYAF